MKEYKPKRISMGLHRYIVVIVNLFFILFLISFIIGCQPLDEAESSLDTSQATENVQGDTESGDGASNGEISSTEDTGGSSEGSGSAKEDGQTVIEEESDDGESKVTIQVYYADPQVQNLVGETRQVSSDNRYIEALNELMKPPEDSTLVSLIPETTKINSIQVSKGIATVDLSEDFVEDRFKSDTEDILLVYSIVNTLTEFNDINFVTFYIDGEKMNVLGMLDLQDSPSRRSDLIMN